jgi:hypothetical protein
MSDVPLNSCGLPSSERSWRDDEEFKKRQQAREETRRREEEQRAVAASTSWYAAVDGRVHEHLKNWLWNAIDERIKQHIEIAQKPLVEATGNVVGIFRTRLRKEFRHAIEELVDATGGQLAALEERLASNNQAAWASLVDGRIEATLHEFKRAIEEAQCSFETKLAALEERLRAVPGKLPVSKIWREESVIYEGESLATTARSIRTLCRDALCARRWAADLCQAVRVCC